MKSFIVYCLIGLFSVEAFGWGQTGHRATGYVAEQYLSAKAKSKLKDIMGQETLWMASTWMDEVRSDSLYSYATDWHFVNLPTGQKYEDAKKNPNGDIIMTLERLVKELKAHTLTHQQEIEHIRMLVHLIGDIHQPLHVGCCDDQGGNKVKVKWFRNDSNLHTVWDSGMIDDTKLAFTELSQSLIKPDKTVVKTWQTSAVLDWAYESLGYEPQIYKIGDGNLSYKYAYQNMPLVKQRLNQAGIRIAGVLNSIYG